MHNGSYISLYAVQYTIYSSFCIEADVSQAALVEEDETDVSDIDEENHSETKKQMTRKKQVNIKWYCIFTLSVQQVSYEDADDEDKEAMESIDTKTKGKEDQRDGQSYHLMTLHT